MSDSRLGQRLALLQTARLLLLTADTAAEERAAVRLEEALTALLRDHDWRQP